MKFKIDENLPKEISEILRKNGYQSSSVNEQQINGIQDEELIDICLKEKKCLITSDLDFANILIYPPDKYYGIVVFRSQKMIKKIQLMLLKNFLELLPTIEIKGRLWIIEIDKARVFNIDS